MHTVRRGVAAAGSSVFFVLAPGVVAGVVPWLLTGWRVRRPLPYWAPLRVAGVALLAAGDLVLVQAFVRFVVEGVGTPAPVAPTEHLVVGGLYRHVRNPMYLAVLTTIIGQALVLGQPALLLYTVAVGAAFATFVRWYEEPALRRRFGEEYEVGRRSPLGARLELHGCSDRLPDRLEDGENLVARARGSPCATTSPGL